MAKRAGDTNANQSLGTADSLNVALYTNNRVQFEQGQRRRRAVEIDLPRGERCLDLRRQSVAIDLEADGERNRGRHGLLNDFVHAQRVGPELLIAECVEAEDSFPSATSAGSSSSPSGPADSSLSHDMSMAMLNAALMDIRIAP